MKKVIILFILILTACNDSDTKNVNSEEKNTNEISVAKYVSTDSELPECSSELNGSLYYVQDLNIFKVCLISNWSNVDTTNSIETNISCNKTIEIGYEDGVNTKTTKLNLNVSIFRNGDTFLSCDLTYRDFYFYSSSNYWTAFDTTSDVPACRITFVSPSDESGTAVFKINSINDIILDYDGTFMSHTGSYSYDFEAEDCKISNKP